MELEIERFLLAERTRNAPETVKGKAWLLRAFSRWLLQIKRHYATLERTDIETYLRQVRRCRAAKISLLQTLRQFYEFHKVNPNPAAEITIKPQKRHKLYKLPATQEVAQAIDELQAPGSLLQQRDRLLVELAYGSGLRRGELMRLDVEDLNLDNQTAQVTGKGSKTRVVPLTGECCRKLRAYLAANKHTTGPLFCGQGRNRRLSVNHISKLFKQRTGLNTHRFRHACATHLLKNGCDLRHIQALLGHARIDTTQIYTHLVSDDIKTMLAENHPRAQQ